MSDTPETTAGGPDTPAAPARPPLPPRCLRLRTKMDYVSLHEGRPSGRPVEWDEDETLGGTAHNYYCLHTMTVLGPDDDLVGPRICEPGRTCYESPGF